LGPEYTVKCLSQTVYALVFEGSNFISIPVLLDNCVLKLEIYNVNYHVSSTKCDYVKVHAMLF